MTESFENTTQPIEEEKNPLVEKIEKLKAAKEFISKNISGNSANLFFGISTQEDYEMKTNEIATELDKVMVNLRESGLDFPRLNRKIETTSGLFRRPDSISHKDHLIQAHQELISALSGMMDVIDTL